MSSVSNNLKMALLATGIVQANAQAEMTGSRATFTNENGLVIDGNNKIISHLAVDESGHSYQGFKVVSIKTLES